MSDEPQVLMLPEAEARRLTEEVKADASALWRKMLALYEGKAHAALGYSSWATYCEAEFDMSSSHAYRLLDAGRLAQIVEPEGNAPDSSSHSSVGEWAITEAHARELVPLKSEPEKLAKTWQELEEGAKASGEPVTAKRVRKVVEAKVRLKRPLRRYGLKRSAKQRQTEGRNLRTEHGDATSVFNPTWMLRHTADNLRQMTDERGVTNTVREYVMETIRCANPGGVLIGRALTREPH